jgi:uncharacterized protein (TIGR02246 family)
MRYVPRPAFALAAVLTMSTAPSLRSAPETSTTAPVQAAISTVWEDHLAAAKRGDVAHIADIYAENAVYVVPGGEETRGKPAIDAMERKGLETTAVAEAAHTTHALRLAGDVAYELGTITGRVGPKGQEPKRMDYHFMAMWQRQASGAWRLRYLIGQP